MRMELLLGTNTDHTLLTMGKTDAMRMPNRMWITGKQVQLPQWFKRKRRAT
jgi:hypothetical protein